LRNGFGGHAVEKNQWRNMVLKIGTFHILIVVEKTRYFLEIVKK
jgi:hypothetical protein